MKLEMNEIDNGHDVSNRTSTGLNQHAPHSILEIFNKVNYNLDKGKSYIFDPETATLNIGNIGVVTINAILGSPYNIVECKVGGIKYQIIQGAPLMHVYIKSGRIYIGRHPESSTYLHLYYGEDGKLYIYNMFLDESVSIEYTNQADRKQTRDTDNEQWNDIVLRCQSPIYDATYWGTSTNDIPGSDQFDQIMSLIMYCNINRGDNYIIRAKALENTALYKQKILSEYKDKIYQRMRKNRYVIIPKFVAKELEDFFLNNKNQNHELTNNLVENGFVHPFMNIALTNTEYITDSRSQETYGEQKLTYKLHITPSWYDYDEVVKVVSLFIHHHALPCKIVVNKNDIFANSSVGNAGKGITIYPRNTQEFIIIKEYVSTLTGTYNGYIPHKNNRLYDEPCIEGCENLLRYTSHSRNGVDLDYRERPIIFERFFGIGPLDKFIS